MENASGLGFALARARRCRAARSRRRDLPFSPLRCPPSRRGRRWRVEAARRLRRFTAGRLRFGFSSPRALGSPGAHTPGGTRGLPRDDRPLGFASRRDLGVVAAMTSAVEAGDVFTVVLSRRRSRVSRSARVPRRREGERRPERVFRAWAGIYYIRAGGKRQEGGDFSLRLFVLWGPFPMSAALSRRTWLTFSLSFSPPRPRRIRGSTSRPVGATR